MLHFLLLNSIFFHFGRNNYSDYYKSKAIFYKNLINYWSDVNNYLYVKISAHVISKNRKGTSHSSTFKSNVTPSQPVKPPSCSSKSVLSCFNTDSYAHVCISLKCLFACYYFYHHSTCFDFYQGFHRTTSCSEKGGQQHIVPPV